MHSTYCTNYMYNLYHNLKISAVDYSYANITTNWYPTEVITYASKRLFIKKTIRPNMIISGLLLFYNNFTDIQKLTWVILRKWELSR